MRPIFLLLLAIAFAACRKDRISLPAFREIVMPTDTDLSAVCFSDSLNGLVTGGRPWGGGIILSSSDGGLNWSIDTLVNNRLESVTINTNGHAFACGMDGLLLDRPIGAGYWVPIRQDWCWNRACCFPNERYGLMASAEGQLRRFGPEQFWDLDSTLVFPAQFDDICFSDSITAVAVGYGWVLLSEDAGHRWRRLEQTGDFFRAIQFPTPAVGYLCGYNGTLLKSADGGRSWREIRKGGALGERNQSFRALYFVNAEKGYLVGDDGLFWRTENGGADWQQVQEAPENVDFTNVFALGRRGWITADGGRFFVFDD